VTDIVLATRNMGKVEEFRAIMADLPVRILSLADFPEMPETPETGTSFAENAELKAKAAVRFTGKLSLADDSGLEVDALGGEPGVMSSRFGGPGASDRDKYMRILDLLEGVEDAKRTARFRAAIAISTLEGETVVVEGSCEGRIAHSPSGERGFGYDPVFYIPELKKTMAELLPEEKNPISHRGKAMKAAKQVLRKLIEDA
jgi:XTP/dITP diphosphohydrolase